MTEYSSDIAFTAAVKAVQSRRGSRAHYARMEEHGAWQTTISDDLKDFIEAQNSVFLATVNAEGQPYIQHRGGPRGFLRVMNDHTIGFVDYVGNRQYITLGNLTESPKAQLFLIDYSVQQRVKIWGELRVIENDPALMTQLMPRDYKARAAQAMVFTVKAWDANCSQHIPQRFEAPDVAKAIAERDQRIAALEHELEQLRLRSHSAD